MPSARQPGVLRSQCHGVISVAVKVSINPAPGMQHITSTSASATASSPAENAHRFSSGLRMRTKRIRPPYTEIGMLLPTNIVWCMTASLK